MTDKDYIPRFAFEVSLEQKNRADKVLKQYGLRRAIFGRILDDVCDMIETHGPGSLGLLITGECKPREIIPILYKADKAGE
jgi:hypothetical protein